MRQAHWKTLHLLFDCRSRMTRYDHYLIDTRSAQSDQLAVDQGDPLQPYQRFCYTPHAPTFTGSQKHGTDAQPRIQAAALFE
jgi:hypothetical protein